MCFSLHIFRGARLSSFLLHDPVGALSTLCHQWNCIFIFHDQKAEMIQILVLVIPDIPRMCYSSLCVILETGFCAGPWSHGYNKWSASVQATSLFWLLFHSSFLDLQVLEWKRGFKLSMENMSQGAEDKVSVLPKPKP